MTDNTQTTNMHIRTQPDTMHMHIARQRQWILWCMLYAVCCILCAVRCILYTVCCILYTVYCTLYAVYGMVGNQVRILDVLSGTWNVCSSICPTQSSNLNTERHSFTRTQLLEAVSTCRAIGQHRLNHPRSRHNTAIKGSR